MGVRKLSKLMLGGNKGGKRVSARLVKARSHSMEDDDIVLPTRGGPMGPPGAPAMSSITNGAPDIIARPQATNGPPPDFKAESMHSDEGQEVGSPTQIVYDDNREDTDPQPAFND